jgi:hypothetical protein
MDAMMSASSLNKAFKDPNADEGDPSEKIDVPMIIVLVGGGEGAKIDVLQAVRRNWNIIIFGGTGGLADEIERVWDVKRSEVREDSTKRRSKKDDDENDSDEDAGKEEEDKYDAAIDEIVNFGQLNFLHIAIDSVEDVTSLLASRLLDSRNQALSPCLVSAWRTYGELNKSSEFEKRKYLYSLYLIRFLTFISTFFVVLRVQLANRDQYVDTTSMQLKSLHIEYDEILDEMSTGTSFECPGFTDDLLLLLSTVTPILTGVMLIIANKFFNQNKYRTLSTAAEKTKRHIYEYRARTNAYSNAKFADGKLSQMVSAQRSVLDNTDAVKTKLVDGETKVIEWLRTMGGREDVLKIFHPEDSPVQYVAIDTYIKVWAPSATIDPDLYIH